MYTHRSSGITKRARTRGRDTTLKKHGEKVRREGREGEHERKRERVEGGIGRDASLLMVHHTREISMVCVYVRVWERVPRVRGVRTEWKWKGSLACLLNED